MNLFLSFLLLILSFWLLTLVVDYFLTPTIYGLKHLYKWSDDKMWTALSFVSSSPELSLSLVAIFVAAYGWWSGTEIIQTISIGPSTVVWSGLFSILFLVWLSGRYIKKPLNPTSIIRDCVYYMCMIALMYWFVSNGSVSLFEWSILFALFFLYFWAIGQWDTWMRKIGQKVPPQPEDHEWDVFFDITTMPWTRQTTPIKITQYCFFNLVKHNSLSHIIRNMFLAAVLIMLLNTVMVNTAVVIATWLWISQTIIALTILAAGTSIPDVLTSIKPAQQWFGDAAMVNAIGSNIFDMLFNLGLTWILWSLLFLGGKSVPVDVANLEQSIAMLFGATAMVLLVFWWKKRYLWKTMSAVFMWMYVAYIVYQIIIAMGRHNHWVAMIS